MCNIQKRKGPCLLRAGWGCAGSCLDRTGLSERSSCLSVGAGPLPPLGADSAGAGQPCLLGAQRGASVGVAGEQVCRERSLTGKCQGRAWSVNSGKHGRSGEVEPWGGRKEKLTPSKCPSSESCTLTAGAAAKQGRGREPQVHPPWSD